MRTVLRLQPLTLRRRQSAGRVRRAGTLSWVGRRTTSSTIWLGSGGGQFWSFSKFAGFDAGTWRLLIGTNNGYTTPTEVKEGTLVVDGSFYGSPDNGR